MLYKQKWGSIFLNDMNEVEREPAAHIGHICAIQVWAV